MRTPAEEAAKAATRKVKDELTRLFHAKARPACGKLRQIAAELGATLKANRAEPYNFLGYFVDICTVRESEHSEQKLRGVLEGVLWEDLADPKYGSLRQRFAEIDLEKQTPEGLGIDFYLYYSDYRILLATVKRLAPLLGVELSADARFIEWQRLDGELTSRLRDVLAIPELAKFRDDFEERISQWV